MFSEKAILNAAPSEGPYLEVAVLLAGDGGLRVGEIRAFEWDVVDLVPRTNTVKRQSWRGIVGTPKGRKRRVVPMTERLFEKLRGLDLLRRGRVIRKQDGADITEGELDGALQRIYRRAGVPQAGWHRLRHTFGTDAARFGANPWTLMDWLGHKRIDETQLYVHVAGTHKRPIPAEVLAAGAGEADPDRRALLMLGCRGKTVAKAEGAEGQGA